MHIIHRNLVNDYQKFVIHAGVPTFLSNHFFLLNNDIVVTNLNCCSPLIFS